METTKKKKLAEQLFAGKAACIRFFGRGRGWFIRNFSGAAPGFCLAASAAAGVVLGVSLADTYWPALPGYLLAGAGIALLFVLGFALVGWILRHLTGWSFRVPIAAGVLGWSTVELFRRGAGEGYSFRVVTFALLAAGILWCFAGVWWRLLAGRRISITTVLSGLVTAAGVGVLAAFLLTDGWPSHYRSAYLALQEEQGQTEAFESALSAGPWEVAVVDYGTEDGLASDTANLAAYVSRSSDEVNGAYADYYLDYDLNAVPMVGRIWYPVGAVNCPVFFIAHGNHEITVDSYLGYDYLGEYLASHGYVVVSMDHNACNLLYNENDGRAVLMLEHIGQVLRYNEDRNTPLYGAIDPDNIAIGGHSRGGEMAATAYLFNGYDRYPENGNITFDYHYNIRSIVAIAPTVNQYKPADHTVKIEDVNYLLLHGSDDRDVTSFMGMAQYENVSFTGEGDYLKSALYIAGANHGQFNSLWGAYDQSAPFSALLNTASLLDEGEQQEIAKRFIKVFLDVTLRGDDSCRSLLTDWDGYAAQLPQTVYYQCWASSDFQVLTDFEEDSDLGTATAEDLTLSAQGMRLWTEELVDFSNDSSFETHALRLRTSSVNSSYALSFANDADLSGKALVLDVMDVEEDAVERGDYELVEFSVRVTDRWGNSAVVEAGEYATVYPGLPVRTDKLDYIFQNCTVKTAFSTVTIPLSDMEGVDLSAVTEISLEFTSFRDLMFDNVGLIAQR